MNFLGKKYCYGSTQGEYCHCDYCKCKHGYGSKGQEKREIQICGPPRAHHINLLLSPKYRIRTLSQINRIIPYYCGYHINHGHQSFFRPGMPACIFSSLFFSFFFLFSLHLLHLNTFNLFLSFHQGRHIFLYQKFRKNVRVYT